MAFYSVLKENIVGKGMFFRLFMLFLVALSVCHQQSAAQVAPDATVNSDSKLFTYKGFVIGDSLSEFQKKLPDWKCGSAKCVFRSEFCTSEKCLSNNSFGGAAVLSGTAELNNGRVSQIYLNFSEYAGRVSQDSLERYDNLKNALINRYGNPKLIDGMPDGGFTVSWNTADGASLDFGRSLFNGFFIHINSSTRNLSDRLLLAPKNDRKNPDKDF